MSLEILVDKASKNYKTGEWAEINGYFDAAISRFYYCAFEKIIYLSKRRGFYEEGNSHIDTINRFTKNMSGTLTGDEKLTVGGLKRLRGMRNNADYKEIQIENANEFNLSFKWSFKQINDILDRLI